MGSARGALPPSRRAPGGRNPSLWWSCGHHDNEAFPFAAFAAFAAFAGSGLSGEADLVVSVDFVKVDGRLRYSCDVGRDDGGELLADGPAGEIALTDDVAAVRERIAEAVRSVAGFVWSSEPLLRAEVCGTADSPRPGGVVNWPTARNEAAEPQTEDEKSRSART